jgi:hypothetical protein
VSDELPLPVAFIDLAVEQSPDYRTESIYRRRYGQLESTKGLGLFAAARLRGAVR